ncbi:MAPK kinase substrate protein [Senna tora]|uniref:MAPK kinase substrate protein n=1 Tax=Senna tora TaxID=362788 RepID=A0A834SP84_9FABA|nr:MAPK kinase substrate protein [Senna tora]
MSKLERSVTSFRGQGSSGMVWNDHKFMCSQTKTNTETETERGDDESGGFMGRSRSAGATLCRSVKVSPPSKSKEPHSPKFSSCCFFCFPLVATRHLCPKSKNKHM